MQMRKLGRGASIKRIGRFVNLADGIRFHCSDPAAVTQNKFKGSPMLDLTWEKKNENIHFAGLTIV